MTVFPDARTPSATVHPLSGSTPPGAGAVMQPFGVATAPAAVHELPDSWQHAGTVTTDTVAGLAARRAAAHPDADVIHLAGRLAALAPRQDRVLCRHCTVAGRVDRWAMDNAPTPPAKRPSRMVLTALSTATHRTLQFSKPLEADADEREEADAYAAARKAHKREKRRRLARTRAPYLLKLADRMWARMFRWSVALAEMEPQTREGQAAKAAAAKSVAHTTSDLDWGVDLLISANRDAVRLAAAAPGAAPEPIITALQRATALRVRIDAGLPDDAADACTTERMILVQRAAEAPMATMDAAIAALEWVRGEFVSAHVEVPRPEPMDVLMLGFLDRALGVLRPEEFARALASAA